MYVLREKKHALTYLTLHNALSEDSCSKGPRGLKFVMRIEPTHAEPTTTFLSQNSTKIVHFFNFFKKNQFLREFSLLRLITYVRRVLGV